MAWTHAMTHEGGEIDAFCFSGTLQNEIFLKKQSFLYICRLFSS